MRELINQDRAMPLGLAKAFVNLIGLAFLIASAAIVVLGVSTLFGGSLLPGLIQIFGGPALLLSIYLLLRLLLEILMSTHRIHDRVGIISEAVREKRQSDQSSS